MIDWIVFYAVSAVFQPYRINENQQWHKKAALYSLNTIAINVMFIDRAENNAYSLQ